MNKDNLKYPYPVLGHLDDINSDWSCTYTSICDEEEIRFIIEIENNFDDLQNLIRANKASYACEIECSRTFLRRAIISYDDKFEVIVHRNEIRDTISLTLYIISTEEQSMYSSDKFKEVYRQSANFLQPLERGEILAQLPEYTLPVDIEYDDINSIPIIEIKKEDCDYEYVNLNSETIQIVLPIVAFDKLNLIKDKYLSIYHSSFIFNALIQAIPEIEHFSDKTWAQKLSIILQDDKFNGLDKESDTSEIIQKLLNQPYVNMIDMLLTINS